MSEVIGQPPKSSGGKGFFELVGDRLVNVYETGGIPLVLIVSGASISLESNFNWLDHQPSGVSNQTLFISGVGLILAGAACWMLDVYFRRQRETAVIDLLGIYVARPQNTMTLEDFRETVAAILHGQYFSDTDGSKKDSPSGGPSGNDTKPPANATAPSPVESTKKKFQL